MVKYLSMDGVDDYLKTPSISADEIVIEMLVDLKSDVRQIYLSKGTDTVQRHYGGTDRFYGTWNGVYLNGVQVSHGSVWMPSNERVTLRGIFPAVSWMYTFFSNNSGGENTKGNIYDIKIYNAGVLQAHYDMSTGTVNDMSGNGNHATLVGGTWLDDGTGGGIEEPIGEEGSTAFDLQQRIYSDDTLSYDFLQRIYADMATSFDTRFISYQDAQQAHDMRAVMYQDSVQSYDTKQLIYEASAVHMDTRQVIYEVASTAFDMLQEYYQDGMTGSTPFDMRIQLYEDSTTLFDSRQEWYSEGFTAHDLQQAIYEAGKLDGDVRLILYADSAVQADMLQTLYTDGAIDFDTLQQLLNEWTDYREVIRITLNITRNQTVTLELVRRKQSELKM